jgi:hypothetical protein
MPWNKLCMSEGLLTNPGLFITATGAVSMYQSNIQNVWLKPELSHQLAVLVTAI